jgi:hypothetical protein
MTRLERCAGMLALATSVASSTARAADEDQTEGGRHKLEIGAEVGPAWPSCSEHRCTGELGSGWAVGLHALLRLHPNLAVGVLGEQAWYPWSAQTALGPLPDETAYQRVVAIAARGYLLREGLLDPYAELALGAMSVAATVSSEQCNETPGPALGAGMGVGLWPVHWARLSLAFAARVGLVIQECDDGGIEGNPPPTPTPSSSLGLRLGVDFGLGPR